MTLRNNFLRYDIKIFQRLTSYVINIAIFYGSPKHSLVEGNHPIELGIESYNWQAY